MAWGFATGLACGWAMLAAQAAAAIVSVSADLSNRGVPAAILGAAPASTTDEGSPRFDAMLGFNERQDVLLTAALGVDGGSIAAGTVVSSHMIFLRPVEVRLVFQTATWTFSQPVIGVMSDNGGTLEAASNAALGAPGTLYPGAFPNRGFEPGDAYTLLTPTTLQVSMGATAPGDWIRVVTSAEVVPIPLPAAGGLLGAALALIAGWGAWIARRTAPR